MKFKSKRTSIRSLTGVLFFIMICSDIFSQETYPKIQKNSVYIEAASAIYIGDATLNYERAVVQGDQIKLFLNTGIGVWYLVPVPKSYSGLSIPLRLNTLLGSGNNFFEIDAGLRYTFYNAESNDDLSPLFPILNLGYRYQRQDGKGLLFRAFIGLSGIGIGVGKSF
ncbi:MAG: hypothetical protein IPN67_10445 [Bacteroidales bacterium]|nr:hypothetical protein [Bacteroidales bacterium]MBK8882779.1 hypothetical protein [Bacteroidales bacterium]